ESFISHLIELRERLMKAVGAVLVLFIALFIWPGSGYIYDLLAAPLMSALPEGAKMIATGVITPFMVPVKVTALAAFLIALPFVIVGAFVVAAVVTPPDVLSQFMLAVPMCVLYEAGLFFARFISVRRENRTVEPAETR